MTLAPPAPVEARPVPDAVLACIARTGVTGLTVDDIAREAGCSRATIYRSFPSKRALVAAAVEAAADRLVGRLVAAADAAPTLADAVTAVVLTGAAFVATEPALVTVADREPHLLHPHLAFEGGDRLLVAAGERLAPAFARFAADPTRVAAWTVRLGLCLCWFPNPPVDVADPVAVADLVATFVAPGLTDTPHIPHAVHRDPGNPQEDR